MVRKAACVVRFMLTFPSLFLTTPAISQGQTDSFDFASKQIGSWAMTATTYFGRSNRENDQWSPTALRVDCRGEARQGSFTVNNGAISSLRLRFLGPQQKNGEQDEITLFGDHLWLYIDGDRWEYAHIEDRGSKFTNGRYAPIGKDEIVVQDWRGFEAVRKSESDPWLNIGMIYERLLDAQNIAWGFKSRDWTVVDRKQAANQLPEQWHTDRYPIDNRNLRDSVVWCARAVSSDAAFILPARFR